MFTTLNEFVNNAQSKYVIVPSCRIGCGISITEKPIFRTNTATSDTFVLSWILTGRGSFVESGRMYQLEPRSVCIRRPMCDWQLTLDEGRSIRLFIDLPAEFYPTFSMLIPELDGIVPVRGDVSGVELLDEFLELQRELEAANAENVYCLLGQLIHYIINIAGIARLRGSRGGTPDKLIQARMLLEDVTSRLTLEEIAARCSMPYSSLRRGFAEKYGISPGRYRTSCRINEAKRALISGEPISSIAERLGFADVYTFTHRFSDEVGKSPSRFRDEGGD